MAGSALLRPDDRTGALRDTLAGLLAMDEPRRHLAAELSGLGLRHDLGDGHPLLGRRMPDLDLVTPDGPRRVFGLLHEGRHVLLDLGGAPGALDATPWSDRVRCLEATCDGPWELPAIGAVTAPAGVLVRPDGHVAWVGEGDARGLAEAMRKWCGAPRA
jgi:3-(3-hydroxy-phenyl)propionate hydroxylase